MYRDITILICTFSVMTKNIILKSLKIKSKALKDRWLDGVTHLPVDDIRWRLFVSIYDVIMALTAGCTSIGSHAALSPVGSHRLHCFSPAKIRHNPCNNTIVQ